MTLIGQVQLRTESLHQAIVLVWGNLVTWRSKKQNVAARSSVEVEYRAMANGVCELLWIQRVLKDLKRETNLPLKLL